MTAKHEIEAQPGIASVRRDDAAVHGADRIAWSRANHRHGLTLSHFGYNGGDARHAASAPARTDGRFETPRCSALARDDRPGPDRSAGGRAGGAGGRTEMGGLVGGSAHGPYPSGNASAQPELEFAFESAAGAIDQTFRLIIKPDLWGNRVRLRLSNTFGTQPMIFDEVFVGVQSGRRQPRAGTNRGSTFAANSSVTVPPGRPPSATLSTFLVPTARDRPQRTETRSELPRGRFDRPDDVARQGADDLLSDGPRRGLAWAGRRRLVSVHDVVLVFPRRCGRHGGRRYLVVACFGDSITDGTGSTQNGDDRWPDVFSAGCTPRTASGCRSSTRESAATAFSRPPSTRRPSHSLADPRRSRDSSAIC